MVAILLGDKMNKVDITQHLMPPPEVAEAIKKELSLESEVLGAVQIVKCGLTNANPHANQLFIPTKKGREYNWAYAESKAAQGYDFFILGTPVDWVRVSPRGIITADYHIHNAPVELWFDTGKLLGMGGESVFCNWYFSFHIFTEFLTPMANETFMENIKHRAGVSLHGQGDGVRTRYEEIVKNGNHWPNPLRYMKHGYMKHDQILSLFRALVADLEYASPTAAKYAREKFTELR